MAVLDPLKLVLTNLDAAHEEALEFPNHPKNPELRHARRCRSRASCGSSATISPKCRRRVSTASCRAAKCACAASASCAATSVVKDADGTIAELHCTLDPETRHGMPGADRKVKGTIHWVSAKHAIAAEVRLYDRLFSVPDPDDDERRQELRRHLNRDSKRVVRAWLEAVARRSRRRRATSSSSAWAISSPTATTTRARSRCSTAP